MQRELMSDVLEGSSDRNWEWTFLDAPLLAAGPPQTPSIHVLGGPRDVLYEEQKKMLEHWSAPGRKVLEHSEGHVPPSRAASGEVIAALHDALDRHLS